MSTTILPGRVRPEPWMSAGPQPLARGVGVLGDRAQRLDELVESRRVGLVAEALDEAVDVVVAGV
jgi:hypothetical protein